MCIVVAITIWVMDKLPCFLIYSPMFIKLFLYTMLKGQTGITLKHFIHNPYIYSLFTLLSIHCLFVVVIVVYYHQCLTHAPGQLLGSRLAFSLPGTQLTTAAFSALFSLLLPLRRASTGGQANSMVYTAKHVGGGTLPWFWPYVKLSSNKGSITTWNIMMRDSDQWTNRLANGRRGCTTRSDMK